jgi:hypothetical protein
MEPGELGEYRNCCSGGALVLESGIKTMPILSYFVGVGALLVALLFVADATLTKSDSPVVPTSTLYGLPKPWKPDAPVQTLVAAPAPVPETASERAQAALAKTEPVNEASARAEVTPKKKHVARKHTRPAEHQQTYAWTPSANRSFGGGFFGRF